MPGLSSHQLGTARDIAGTPWVHPGLCCQQLPEPLIPQAQAQPEHLHSPGCHNPWKVWGQQGGSCMCHPGDGSHPAPSMAGPCCPPAVSPGTGHSLDKIFQT